MGTHSNRKVPGSITYLNRECFLQQGVSVVSFRDSLIHVVKKFLHHCELKVQQLAYSASQLQDEEWYNIP